MENPHKDKAPDAGMDQLHWLVVERLGAAIAQARIALEQPHLMPNGPSVETALLNADGYLAQVIEQLDSLMPGGCPDER